MGARDEHDELGNDRGHGDDRDGRPESAGASPRAGAGCRKGSEGDAEHPDADDRDARQLPDPVVGGGREEGDAARRRRGYLGAAERERRAHGADSGDDDEAGDEQEADDPELARAPRGRGSARTG